MLLLFENYGLLHPFYLESKSSLPPLAVLAFLNMAFRSIIMPGIPNNAIGIQLILELNKDQIIKSKAISMNMKPTRNPFGEGRSIPTIIEVFLSNLFT